MFTVRITGFSIVLMMVAANAHAAVNSLSDLRFNTEEYPPANFTLDGKLQGFAVDILLSASQMMGQEVKMDQIHVGPWARSYRATLTQKDAVLFSTTRTEHRENLFNWVGPISDIKVVVLARKDANIKINDPMEMANYTIGVIRDDIGEQSLLAMGIPRDAMQEASYVTTLAEQLMKKRIDLLAYDEKAAYWWAKQVGVESSLFEAVYTLREGEVYYAFNKHIPQPLLDELQQALDEMKTTMTEEGVSLYDSIIFKYR